MEIASKWGLPEIDLFANRSNTKLQSFFLSKSKGSTSGSRCSLDCMGFQSVLRLPSPIFNSKSPIKIQSRTCISNTDSSVLAKKGMVFTSAIITDQPPWMLPSNCNLLSQGPVFHPSPEMLNLAAWYLKQRS